MVDLIKKKEARHKIASIRKKKNQYGPEDNKKALREW